MDEPVRQNEDQVRQFMAVQEAESRRLSRRLHDEIGQLLAALCMRLHLVQDLDVQDAGPHLGECLAIAQQSIEKVREISFDLSPLMLEGGSLLDTVRYYLDHQSRRHGLAVDFTASSSWTPLPREVEGACLRLVQEAVGNVIQHASARHVQVELRQDAEATDLTIRDDGVGFSPASLSQPCVPPRTLGLTAVRQRIELLGGKWHVESAPGQGTVIRATLPVTVPRTAAFPS